MDSRRTVHASASSINLLMDTSSGIIPYLINGYYKDLNIKRYLRFTDYI